MDLGQRATGRKLWGALMVPLLLAGCHDRQEKKAEAAPGGNYAIANAEENAAPPAAEATRLANGAAPAGPYATAPMTAEDNAIPEAFHGRWGMVAGDCGPDASIAKGLVVITGRMLRFYESVGKPDVVRAPTPNRLEGRFSFSGEGESWEKDMVLEIKGDGGTLIRTEKKPTASFTYKKCAS